MDLEELKDLCAGLPGADASYPFGPGVLVYKVRGKIFALIREDQQPLSCNLKCDPALARDLRRSYPSIQPGYHMNKEHWNTLVLDGTLEGERVRWLVEHSYGLVTGKG